MNNYLFTDGETGEDFIVQANSVYEACQIAEKYFADPNIIDPISDEEAEMMGVDTY